MEAEKAHDLPSAGWRPRKAGGVVPVESQRPETQDCWCPRAGEDGRISPSREQIHPSSTSLSHAGPQLIGRCTSTEVRATFWTQATKSEANLFSETPLQTHPAILFDQLSGPTRPVKLTHNHHTNSSSDRPTFSLPRHQDHVLSLTFALQCPPSSSSSLISSGSLGILQTTGRTTDFKQILLLILSTPPRVRDACLAIHLKQQKGTT